MSVILLIIAAITLYLDISRHYNPKIKDLIDKFLGKFLRHEEKSGNFSLSGATYMALGLFFTCLFFPKNLAIAAWLILILSDCFAAIMGMKFGTPLPNGKSYVGASAFFISAVFISIITYFFIGYSTSFSIIILSSLFTSLAEFYSKEIKVNDNFSIPLVYAFSTVILDFIL